MSLFSFDKIKVKQLNSCELSLIEEKSFDFPDEYNEMKFEWIDNVKTLFDRELSDPAICSASWSLDGHHGLMGLKSRGPGTGMQWSEWILNRNSDGSRSLGYGTTHDGKSLFVLHGYNSNAVKRHYMIAFYRDALNN